MKVNIKDISSIEPVSVMVQGECNHADTDTYFTDRDGEEYEVRPPDSVWTNENTVCNTCGAEWNEFDKSWQDTIQSIRFMNDYFKRLQNGQL